MAGKGTAGALYGAVQPWTRTPDEIIDKHVQRKNIDRELDIREGKLKADEEARKAKKRRYAGEEGIEKAPANWSKVSRKILNDASAAYVAIQNSDLSEEDQERYMAQIDSNPDSLMLMFSEYQELSKALTGTDGNLLKEGERANMLGELSGVIAGEFDVILDTNDYTMKYIDAKGVEFSVQDMRNHLADVKKNFGDQVSEINRFNTASANNVFNQKPGTMLKKGSNGLWKVRDKEELWTTYSDLASNVGGGLGDERLEQMYTRDLRGAEFLMEQLNDEARKKKETKDTTKNKLEAENVDLNHNYGMVTPDYDSPMRKPDDVQQITSGSVGLVLDRGAAGVAKITMVNPETGEPVEGVLLDYEYDGNGDPTSVNIVAINPTEIEKDLAAANIQNMSAEVLYAMYSKQVISIPMGTGSEYDKQNYSILNANAKGIMDRVKREVTSYNRNAVNKSSNKKAVLD